MKLWRFQGLDSEENALFEIIVIADNMVLAGILMRQHLVEIGRPELIPKANLDMQYQKVVPEQGVLNSTVRY